MNDRHRMRRGFSLIELVIVVVILAIIGAIAIPRLSRGAEGAADSALISDLAVMRGAIDLFQTEHVGQYPTFASFVNQLTQYTDDLGNVNAAKGGAFIYGPYLRKIPPLPLGAQKGQSAVTDTQGAAGAGWVYNDTTGALTCNTTVETDASGTLYNTY